MRKAIDWEKGLSNALAKSLENTGSVGCSGDKANMPNNDGHFWGTTPAAGVTANSPVVASGAIPVTTQDQSNFRHVVSSGYRENRHLQALPAKVTTRTAVTTDIKNIFAERAAIIEFDAGLPRAWAESFARLDQTAPPAGFSPEGWRTLVDDGGRFLDRWTSQAIRADWLPGDVFEVEWLPDTAPFRVGLVQIIGGGQVLEIADEKVTIRTGSGICIVYERRMYGLNCTWSFDNFAAPEGRR